MRQAVAWGLLAILVTGCASSQPKPDVYVYPTKGQDAEQQARDTSECQTWAQQQSGYDPATETAKGAGFGALLGAAIGAAGGAAVGAITGTGAGTGAAVGAVVGGIGGGVSGGATQYARSRDGYDRAYSACMSARGYSVR